MSTKAGRQPKDVPPAAVPPTGRAPARKVDQKPPVHRLTSIRGTSDACRRLAEGETNRAVAAAYGLQPSSVAKFKARNGAKIQALRAQLEKRAAEDDGLWIARRADRLAFLQDCCERLTVAIDAADDDALPELVRTSISALHEAAEQLGQLPSRTTVAATTIVNYRFHGVDLEAL